MALAFLTVISWFFLWKIYSYKGLCARSSFLAASVTWGVMTTAATEILSAFKLLSFTPVLIFWVGASASLLVFTCLIITAPKREKKSEISELSFFLKVLLGGILAILFLTGLTASIAPPNNWDSMTYHMSRVMHWIQNRSVGHYPTHILRQIELTPWAEFAIAHLQILSGGDYWANLVQWFSMAGSIIGVSLIAKEFGSDLRGQVFAAVFAATIPMGILQSTSTQNDYAVSFWLVCFVYYGMLIRKEPRWKLITAFSASLGLAFLTKGTAYIYALPIFIFFAFPLMKVDLSAGVKSLFGIVAIVLAINAGHFGRNAVIFSNPLHSGEITYSNESFTFASLISNICRNTALHIGTPWNRVNKMNERLIGVLHRILNKDINDPKTTYAGRSFKITKTSLFEDTAGNPLHVALIICSMIFLLRDKQLRSSQLTGFFFAFAAAFLLFCFYLKWQPWGSRLQLPLFVLWSPVIAVVFSRARHGQIMNAIAVLCLIASLPWVISNKTRPILGRDSIFVTNRIDNYFSAQPWTRHSYFNVAMALNGANCNSIGLLIGGDDYEYPLWLLLQKAPSALRIEHVNVTNKSGNILPEKFNPCAVIKSDKNKMLSVNWIDFENADLISDAAPCGFKVEGMGEPEGPYQKWNLPRVRWAKDPDVQIHFVRSSDANNPLSLFLSFRPLTRDFARMTVLLNNAVLRDYEVNNGAWNDDVMNLMPRAGSNILQVRFEPFHEEKPPDKSLYMLFRKFAFEVRK